MDCDVTDADNIEIAISFADCDNNRKKNMPDAKLCRRMRQCGVYNTKNKYSKL